LNHDNETLIAIAMPVMAINGPIIPHTPANRDEKMNSRTG